jgi:choice-of-anchor C domain-containing protein
MNRLGVFLGLSFFCSAAWCAPFQNGDFEVGGICGNVYDVTGSGLPGWTVITGNIDWEGPPSCGGWAPSSGTHSLDLVGQTFGVGGIAQTFDTVPGTTYQVSFDLAGNYGNPPVVKPLAVTVGGVVHNFSFDTTGRSAANMGWTTQTFTFVASSATTTISFVSDVSAYGPPNNAGAALDNVRIAPLSVASVPLDWAQWAAALLILVAGSLVFGRRRTAG